MPVSLSYMRDVILDGLRQRARTLYGSNSATTGLGYGLGGLSTTAQSSLNAAVVQAHLAMQQAQLQAHEYAQAQAAVQAGFIDPAHVAPTTVTVTSTGGWTPVRQMVSADSTDANKRSMELFYDWCNAEQRKSVFVNNYFDVIGGDTGKRYRIYRPMPFNIHELASDSEEPVRKICFVPKDTTLPSGDIWLTQKLGLELDENATLDIANIQTYHSY